MRDFLQKKSKQKALLRRRNRTCKERSDSVAKRRNSERNKRHMLRKSALTQNKLRLFFRLVAAFFAFRKIRLLRNFIRYLKFKIIISAPQAQTEKRKS